MKAEKIKFTLEKVEGNSRWKVTTDLPNSKPEVKYFSSENEVRKYTEGWMDITISNESPYQAGTEWWFYSVEEECIIRVVVKEIKNKVDTTAKMFYSILVFENGISIDTHCLNNKGGYRITNKKELPEALDRILKKEYTEFLYEDHQRI